jgi:hypothetical protein
MRVSVLVPVCIAFAAAEAPAAPLDPFGAEAQGLGGGAPRGEQGTVADSLTPPLFGSPSDLRDRPTGADPLDPALIDPDAGLGPVERGRREAGSAEE